jgi:hypothetical protein
VPDINRSKVVKYVWRTVFSDMLYLYICFERVRTRRAPPNPVARFAVCLHGAADSRLVLQLHQSD